VRRGLRFAFVFFCLLDGSFCRRCCGACGFLCVCFRSGALLIAFSLAASVPCSSSPRCPDPLGVMRPQPVWVCAPSPLDFFSENSLLYPRYSVIITKTLYITRCEIMKSNQRNSPYVCHPQKVNTGHEPTRKASSLPGESTSIGTKQLHYDKTRFQCSGQPLKAGTAPYPAAASS
jgi:hypothetical protein